MLVYRKLKYFYLYFDLFFKLGIKNCIRVFFHKFRVKFDLYKNNYNTNFSDSFFFIDEDKNNSYHFIIKLFGWKEFNLSNHTKWNYDYINNYEFIFQNSIWTQALKSFPEDQDIKCIWELNRFYWLPQLALEHKNNNVEAGILLECLVKNWVINNPFCKGINWTCGQEISIRLLNVILALIILDNTKKLSKNILEFLYMHLLRIQQTFSYGLGQDNNHGVTEAAALYIGGQILKSNNYNKTDINKIIEKGKYYLNERSGVLILNDGSSNQYSSNYHRIILDVYNFIEIIIQKLGFEKLDRYTYDNLSSASKWLFSIVEESNGRVPNLGANDSSYLFNLLKFPHNDFRPTLELSFYLFLKLRPYNQIYYLNRILDVYDLNDNKITEIKHYENFNQNNEIKSDTNLLKINHNSLKLFFRLPKFKYRPCQCDVLNIDIWSNGENLILDDGSYSYNSKRNFYFLGSNKCHNTVEFDGRDQMKKVTPFLYGNWLHGNYKVICSDKNNFTVSASYADAENCIHERTITVYNDDKILIRDDLKNFAKCAVLRWRLPDYNWKRKDNLFFSEFFDIEINSSCSDFGIKIKEGFTSMNYQLVDTQYEK
jgi:hypothetical protein